jgi:hypothetical protein
MGRIIPSFRIVSEMELSLLFCYFSKMWTCLKVSFSFLHRAHISWLIKSSWSILSKYWCTNWDFAIKVSLSTLDSCICLFNILKPYLSSNPQILFLLGELSYIEWWEGEYYLFYTFLSTNRIVFLYFIIKYSANSHYLFDSLTSVPI